MNDLIERLRARGTNGTSGISFLRNPDGPEAANEITRLREALEGLVAAIEAPRCGDDSIWDDLLGYGDESGGPLARARKALTSDIGQERGMMNENSGRVPAAPGSREPSQQAVSAASGFDPSRKWLRLFAALQTDAAVESAARSIAHIILEEYDGARHGSINWDTLAGGDKDIIRVIARRSMRALTSHAHVEIQRRDTDGSGEASETPLGGSTRSATAGAAESGIAHD